ncbi:MAG: TlpA family protein disulfide reductase [Chloroflexi bacterium]|nr:TlpA family protein disulfide reductase [Chloroflexota bacterium]
MNEPSPHPAHSTAHPGTLPRWIALTAGIACAAASLVIVLTAGLPDLAKTDPLYVLDDGRIVAPVIGALAPPLRLHNLDGAVVDLAEYSDQVVVLNSWATWCVPCEVEMPALQALAERYAGRVTVLGVNAGEQRSAVTAWRDRFGLTFELVLDPDGTASRDYRLRGQPTTFIVAPGGRIEAIYFGPVDLAELERIVSRLVAMAD